MRAWFESLEARERWFVAIGALLVAVMILYGLVWAPLDRRHGNLSASVSDWQRSLAQIKPLVGMAADSEAQPKTRDGKETPVVIVDRTLRARGLYRSLQRSQPTPDNGIRVEFENVAFDELIRWLGDLSGEYAMEVASGSLSSPSRAEPGRVNATLVLERVL